MEDKETIKPFWDDDKSKKISDKLPYFNEDEKPFEYKYYNGKLDNIIIKRKQPPKVNETLKDEVDDEIDFELFNDINSKLDSLIEADDKQWEIMNEKMAIIREKLDNILNKVSKNKKSKINKEENLFVLKTRKIRLYPTKEQKIILQKWFDGARTTYNNTVHYINTEVRAETQTIKELLNTTELEKKFVTKTSYFCEKCNKFIKKMLICKDCNTPAIPKINENLKKELEEIPSHIRQFSCKSVVTAFKSSLTNLKNGNISNFKIDFKAKKKIKHDSIDITHKDCPIMRDTVDNLYGFNFYPKKLGFVTIVKEGRKIRNKTLKRLPDKVDHDYKIYYDYITKKYFACIPVKQYIPKHKNTSTILSGDPGVRTFLTLYDSSNGDCIKINNRKYLIMRLIDKINTMKSLSDTLKIKRFEKKIRKYHNRISNVISDFHWRIADYISKYKDCSTVLLPHFESQKMIKKNANDFNSTLMYYNRHYQFAQKLTWKCMKVGIIVKRVNESYTSKTCGVCGTINNKLGNSKIFNCVDNNCINKNIERDYHAARNILIKNYDS